MRRILSGSIQTLALTRPGGASAGEARIELGTPAHAATLLRSLARDPMNIATLRAALAEEIGRQRVGRLRHAEVVAQLATQVARGRLRLVPLAAAGAVIKPPPVDGLARVSSGAVKEAEPVVLESTTAPSPEPKLAPEEQFRIDFSTEVEEDLVLGFETAVEDDKKQDPTADAKLAGV